MRTATGLVPRRVSAPACGVGVPVSPPHGHAPERGGEYCIAVTRAPRVTRNTLDFSCLDLIDLARRLVLDAAPSAITTEALAWLYSDD